MHDDPAAMVAALIDGKGEGRYGLSDINQRAHALQAAWLAEQEALAFAALPHVAEAVRLRRFDEAAKGIRPVRNAAAAER